MEIRVIKDIKDFGVQGVCQVKENRIYLFLFSFYILMFKGPKGSIGIFPYSRGNKGEKGCAGADGQIAIDGNSK
jgi:hypothetical protein